MLTRRTFLALSACAGSLAAQSGGEVRIGCQTNAWPVDPHNFEGFIALLRHIRSLGFQGFETSFLNVQGQFANAEAARKQIEQTGLAITGIHIFLLKYDPETALPPMDLIRRVADGAARLGAQRVVVSGGALLQQDRVDPAALGRKAAALNAAGEYCRKLGLRIAYHNHDPEFRAGGAEIEGLLAKTQPELVHFFPDAGYIFLAQADVVQFFERHHARIDGFHLRDFSGPKESDQVPLGQGKFDLRPLAAAMRRLRWRRWVLAEEEREGGGRPGDSAIVPAHEYLAKTFGA